MFDIDTLKALQSAETLRQALANIEANSLSGDLLPLPAGFNLHDLEQYLPGRRRMRGTMNTTHPSHFFKFCAGDELPSEGVACFVDPKRMAATTIFNLGTEETPGHADHTATLTLDQTAEYRALRKITSTHQKQKELAEWMEDWGGNLTATKADGSDQDIKQAVQAVRAIDIKAVRNVGSEVSNLSATRSTLEKVSAESQHHLPAELTFRCVPYQGLGERTFQLRLSALTGGDVLALSLQIRRLEAVEQEMADEFATLCDGSLGDIPVFVGTYSAGK